MPRDRLGTMRDVTRCNHYGGKLGGELILAGSDRICWTFYDERGRN
jgi:hypothetical protein